MNSVELDTPALDAEADRLLTQAPPELTGETPAIADPGAVSMTGSWLEVTPGIVVAADLLLLPQWNLRGDEKDQLSGALAGVLDQIFPGGMGDARWAPYIRLIAITTAIAFSRRDPTTGEFPPLGPMKRAEKADAAPSNGAGDGDRKAA